MEKEYSFVKINQHVSLGGSWQKSLIYYKYTYVCVQMGNIGFKVALVIFVLIPKILALLENMWKMRVSTT